MMPPVSGNTALFLDIDGTLLDLARTPDRVKVPHELPRALEKLSRQLSGALAFVSGRSLDSIDTLFAPFRPAAIGAHGGEVRGFDGMVARSRALPDSVRDIFVGLAGAIPALIAMYRDYLAQQATATLAGRQVLLIRTEPLAETTSPTIDNRLIATADADIRGKRIQAYAYLQRPVRP